MNLITLHGGLMGLGFLCMLVAIIIAKFFKNKDWWFKIHRGLNVAAPILAIAGIITAIVMVSPGYGVQLPLTHHIIGLITLVLLIVQPVLGFSMFKSKDKEKKAQMRKMHKILGWITPFLYLVAIIAVEIAVGG
ncbi:MAG TPA: cytochrome b561 domain-containing protein [Spirochaetales bacterium]|nr:cytochrome b561 domain-containing protein [Spirochaetales bacterium]